MPDPSPAPSRDLADLLRIMAALRTPGTGCSWDLAQSFETIAPYTIEEAYEVTDAIARGDREDLREELGDLLLQVVFHARIAEEEGAFAFGDVVEAITAKLIRRHPHVFGDARDLPPDAVKAIWDEIKRAEKAERAARRGPDAAPGGVLDEIGVTLPALPRADRIARKAASVGFTWSRPDEILAKLDEEVGELREAVACGDRAAVAGEIGDALFTLANLARHLDLDPEAALAGTNAKFQRRFGFVERRLREGGRTLAAASLDEMETLWREAKAGEG